jgi:hypothetical protein
LLLCVRCWLVLRLRLLPWLLLLLLLQTSRCCGCACEHSSQRRHASVSDALVPAQQQGLQLQACACPSTGRRPVPAAAAAIAAMAAMAATAAVAAAGQSSSQRQQCAIVQAT